MKQVIRMLMLAIGILALGDHSAGAQQPADIDAVKAANQTFYEAASARDLAQMDAVWAHEPYVRAIHPGRPMQEGWKAVRPGWQELFELFTDISVSMPDPHVRVGVDTAWVTGQEQFKGRMGSGEEASETLLATSVFEKSSDQWLMVHHHVSGLPLPPQE